ncbi:MAG: 50S ribosomal protein L29 [Patescibacteria group bacterium]|jgi:ribosomal protein L29
MEMKELKTKSQSELNKLLGDFRDKLRDLRFRDASKQLKNVRDIRTLRQDIARIMTVLNSNK